MKAFLWRLIGNPISDFRAGETLLIAAAIMWVTGDHSPLFVATYGLFFWFMAGLTAIIKKRMGRNMEPKP